MRRFSLAILVGALSVALAPVGLNRNVRNTYIDEISKVRAHAITPEYLMVGDSLTANGQPWGWRLSWDPLSTVVVARGGARTDQLVSMLKGAPPAKHAFILLGTNDVGDGVPINQFVDNYRKILGGIKAGDVTVTLIPPSAFPDRNVSAKAYNDAIGPLLKQRHVRVIDLSANLAPDGKPDPEMFLDGIHFTPRAYAIWRQKLTGL